MNLVEGIEKETNRSLVAIDIGGGLSTSYKDANEPEEFSYTDMFKGARRLHRVV